VLQTKKVLSQTKHDVHQTSHDVEQTNDDVYQATKVVSLERDAVFGLEEHRLLSSDDVCLYQEPLWLAAQHLWLHGHGQ
jgi:hypothetical protein